MPSEPQATPYRPDPALLVLASWLGDPVEAAHFPQHIVRFRNERWDKGVGLDSLSEDQWVKHFSYFQPLPDNFPQPLALRYHGHQFRNYNPDIGDGRGFLFAQLRDYQGRLLDLGTKGSGQTPYSRFGDGRLTLKGAVREILATEMLEALGANTSKTFSVIETGENLTRNDEPSPTRSAVLVRLSHGHIRFGTFQRLLALKDADSMKELVDYCLTQFPGNTPPEEAPDREEPAVLLLHNVVERMADLAASYTVSGFVHGVLNTDNMNVSGESFDYGPWRWLPTWDGDFTAAYFDHQGLYAFGRQADTLLWNCGQLGIALSLISSSSKPLIAALDRYAALYRSALARRFTARLGLQARGETADIALIAACEAYMRESGIAPDQFFFRFRAARNQPDIALQTGPILAEHLAAYTPSHPAHEEFWNRESAPSLVIEEVERVWAAIDQNDDWQPLYDLVEDIRTLGRHLAA